VRDAKPQGIRLARAAVGIELDVPVRLQLALGFGQLVGRGLEGLARGSDVIDAFLQLGLAGTEVGDRAARDAAPKRLPLGPRALPLGSRRVVVRGSGHPARVDLLFEDVESA
jgi:hypothetical protein